MKGLYNKLKTEKKVLIAFERRENVEKKQTNNRKGSWKIHTVFFCVN